MRSGEPHAAANSTEVPSICSLADYTRHPEWCAAPRSVGGPFLFAGRSTLIYAPPKSGKSTLLGTIAAQVSQGIPILGRFAPEPMANVLWIAWDEHHSDVARRLLSLDAFPEAIRIVTRRVPTAELLESVRTLQPALVVLDSLSQFLDAIDENMPAAAQQLNHFCSAIRAAAPSAALLIIHHASDKASSSGGHLGHTHLASVVDIKCQLKVFGAADSTKRQLVIRGRCQPAEIVVDFDGERYRATGESPATVSVSDAGRTALTVLTKSSRALRAREWEAACSPMASRTFYSALKQLTDLGFVAKSVGDYYQASPSGRAVR
jgi:hypothetical protein